MVAKHFDLKVQLERATVISTPQHMIDHFHARIRHCDAIIDGIDTYLTRLPDAERAAIVAALESMADIRRRASTRVAHRRTRTSHGCRPSMTSEAATAALVRCDADRSDPWPPRTPHSNGGSPSMIASSRFSGEPRRLSPGARELERARRIAISLQDWPAAADQCLHAPLSKRLRRVASLEHRQRDSIKHVLVQALS